MLSETLSFYFFPVSNQVRDSFDICYTQFPAYMGVQDGSLAGSGVFQLNASRQGLDRFGPLGYGLDLVNILK